MCSNNLFADHELIVAALERRDGEAAAQAVEQHLRNVHRSTVDAMEKRTMTRKARIGVIGAGWWATVSHLPALKANPDCDIVAVNRLGHRNSRRSEAPSAFRLAFEDWREMLDEGADGRRRDCIAPHAAP